MHHTLCRQIEARCEGQMGPQINRTALSSFRLDNRWLTVLSSTQTSRFIPPVLILFAAVKCLLKYPTKWICQQSWSGKTSASVPESCFILMSAVSTFSSCWMGSGVWSGPPQSIVKSELSVIAAKIRYMRSCERGWSNSTLEWIKTEWVSLLFTHWLIVLMWWWYCKQAVWWSVCCITTLKHNNMTWAKWNGL